MNLRDVCHSHITRLLCDRGWFRRTWILQEAGSGSNVSFLYGKRVIGWATLQSAFHGLLPRILAVGRKDKNVVQTAIESITLIASLREGLDHPYKTLFELAVETSRNHCTDEKDKIYALLGLASDWRQHSSFDPKYDKNITVENVYTDFAKWDCSTNNSLRILSCGSGPKSTSGSSLPSWVPDWRTLGEQGNQDLLLCCIGTGWNLLLLVMFPLR